MNKFEKYQIAKRAVAVALVVLIAIFVDQLTKLIAFAYLPNKGDSFPLIPGWFEFCNSVNSGIAFSIGSDNRPFMIVVMIATVILGIGMPVAIFTLFKGNTPAQFALAVIEGGAIGNFIDRLFVRNAEGVAVVRDFLNLSAIRPFAFLGLSFNFGVCNVADFCTTLGVVALLIILLFIGPTAVFPLKKSWREEAKRREEAKSKEGKHAEK